MSSLERVGALRTEWTTKEEIDTCLITMAELLDEVWEAVKNKWPELFNNSLDDRRIIQGSIGYSSLNRYFNSRIKNEIETCDIITIKQKMKKWISEIDVSSDNWKAKSGIYSKYSSEAGYSIVANELLRSVGIIGE